MMVRGDLASLFCVRAWHRFLSASELTQKLRRVCFATVMFKLTLQFYTRGASKHRMAAAGAFAEELAGATGLEPAASCVTGRRSNQLNYAPHAAGEMLRCDSHPRVRSKRTGSGLRKNCVGPNSSPSSRYENSARRVF